MAFVILKSERFNLRERSSHCLFTTTESQFVKRYPRTYKSIRRTKVSARSFRCLPSGAIEKKKRTYEKGATHFYYVSLVSIGRRFSITRGGFIRDDPLRLERF